MSIEPTYRGPFAKPRTGRAGRRAGAPTAPRALLVPALPVFVVFATAIALYVNVQSAGACHQSVHARAGVQGDGANCTRGCGCLWRSGPPAGASGNTRVTSLGGRDSERPT
ncbi:hypothetical protein HYPSUDRAFT_202293 [Hypholoma sublateritium FD-334 SS-4]|uniref:Uncharacterized protein n=1 Tax=Hypholoma sublateritium (strain FD-334 SS-4) TaxID=945553 RepID=A0A0D2P0P0_HYPSF|nr:hypothetical protein HYPSUDRAFT_202293 [Hypholoma sublateritium FD-334 SS-4]